MTTAIRHLSNYSTGERLSGEVSAGLIAESDAETERTGTGAVSAFKDAKGVWQFVAADQESSLARRHDIVTVYVEA